MTFPNGNIKKGVKNKMNEYEECLFCHIMDDRWKDIKKRKDYRLAREKQDRLRESLEATLTTEQKKKLEEYEEGNSACGAIEMEYLFCEILTMIRRICFG